MNLNYHFNQYHQKIISGKYITHNSIENLLQPFANNIYKSGKSVNNNPIHSYQFGRGKIKLLFWSQMHGNEPTTTKALLDFIKFLNSNEILAQESLKKFTIVFIPILNPDGALAYTRENANLVDINRDFINQSQLETNLLLAIYHQFKPDFCFNLHDQRSIFAAGYLGKPATLSFLAPSYNIERDFNATRLHAVDLINHLYKILNVEIPYQIGRFDDSFNINCAGDYFTSLNTPTILIEAGHYPNDYNREISRKYVFFTLLSTLNYNYENVIDKDILPKYLNIPQNFKHYYDIIFKNVAIFVDNSKIITNFAVQYKEQLLGNNIFFNAFVEEIGSLVDKKGHLEYNCNNEFINNNQKNTINIGDTANFFIGNKKYENGILIN
jgi:hypothetical protein